jgi:hypothetical protein
MDKGGQQLDSEVVANFGSVVLLEAMGRKQDSNRGGAWQHIQAHCAEQDADPVSVCRALFNRTCSAVALVLDTADALAAVRQPVAKRQRAPRVSWASSAMLFIFACCVGVMVITAGEKEGRFIDPRLDPQPIHNAWLHLGALAAVVLTLFVGTIALRSRVAARRMQLAVTLALLMQFVGITSLWVYPLTEPEHPWLKANQVADTNEAAEDDSPLDSVERFYNRLRISGAIERSD